MSPFAYKSAAFSSRADECRLFQHGGLSSTFASGTFILFFSLEKQRRVADISHETSLSKFRVLRKMQKRQFVLLQAILSSINPPRTRKLWMRPHSLAWFDMAEACFTQEQWYSNFWVTKGTFSCILLETQGDMCRQHTQMRRAVSPEHRLAITLYFLVSTA